MPGGEDSLGHASGVSLVDVESAGHCDGGAEAPVATVSGRKRMHSMDMMRGTIMIIMAWDHCRDYIGDAEVHAGGMEIWSGPLQTYEDNVGVWLVRFVSHICAPGFMYLMGFGMALLSDSRDRRGWSLARIAQHFLVRGAVLMLAERLLNVPLQFLMKFAATGEMPSTMGLLLGYFWVMNALGEVMILSGCFVLPAVLVIRRVRSSGQALAYTFLILVIAANFVISNIAIEGAQGEDTSATVPWPRAGAKTRNLGDVLLRFFLLPGSVSDSITVLYVCIPWMGVTCFGMLTGFAYLKAPASSQRLFGSVSGTLMLAFLFVRFFGGPVGNLRGLPHGDGSSNSFIAFFTLCKYPPSLSYSLLTVGVDTGLLFIFGTASFTRAIDSGRASWIISPVVTFGRVPFFFFIGHILMYCLIGYVILGFFGGLPLLALIPVWAIVVCAMLPLCRAYDQFKSTTDENSLWRLL